MRKEKKLEQKKWERKEIKRRERKGVGKKTGCKTKKIKLS